MHILMFSTIEFYKTVQEILCWNKEHNKIYIEKKHLTYTEAIQ